jgi:hypothetical protein
MHRGDTFLADGGKKVGRTSIEIRVTRFVCEKMWPKPYFVKTKVHSLNRGKNGPKCGQLIQVKKLTEVNNLTMDKNSPNPVT